MQKTMEGYPEVSYGMCIMNTYNVDFLLAGLLFLLLILRHFLPRPRLHLIDNRSFLWTVGITIAYIAVGIMTAFLLNGRYQATQGTMEFMMTMLCILQVMVPQAFMKYIQDMTERNYTHSFFTIFTRYVLPFWMCTVIAANHWTGMFFTVGPDSLVTEGHLRNWLYVLSYVYILFLAYYTYSRGSRIDSKQRKAVFEVLLYATLSIVIQLHNPDILLSGFSAAVCVTVLFFTINNPYSRMDTLSGAFDSKCLEEMFSRSCRNDMDFQIVAITLSQLERLNVMLGENKANEILRDLASILMSFDRNSTVFRSGRRFIIACPTQASYSMVAMKAEILFSRRHEIENEEIEIPASICLIDEPGKIDSYDRLLSYIRFISSSAPDDRTVVVRSNEALLRQFRHERKIEEYLGEALANDLFTLNYQPIWNTREKRYTMVECLSRLTHPELGNIPPDMFIQMAEDNGQIGALGELQMERLCRFLDDNRFLVERLDSVKVNLSPAEIMREGHVRKLVKIMEDHGLPLGFFQFEITETVATRYGEAVEDVMDFLQERGISLSLDDFGSGYANLNSVLGLPFEEIKLDKSMLSRNDLGGGSQNVLFAYSIAL